jgi:tetratricopeptide (TPR) repeat protein
MDSVSVRPWLLHPVVDVMVGGGLLAVPLALLAAVAEPSSAMAIAVAMGAVVINGPHYAATLVRAWQHSAQRRRWMMVATVAAIVVAVAAHVMPQALPWLFTAYLSISPWHYATQNHGIGLLMAARGGVMVTTMERRALKLAHTSLAMAAIVSLHGGASDGLIMRAGISAPTSNGITALLVIVAAVMVAWVCGSFHKRGSPSSVLAMTVVLLSTSMLWFVVPTWTGQMGSLAYAGGVAVVHCAQYLWISYFVEGRAGFLRGSRFDGVAWFGLVIGLGVVLFTVGPWLSSRLLGNDLFLSLLIVQAVVNLHHFVIDATLWKLRDPTLRSTLMGHDRAPSGREQVSTLRALLWGLPVAGLVVVAAVDVVQLAGTRVDASDEVQRLAMAQNEYDVRVWLRAARRAAAANDDDGTRVALSRAVELSPTNLEAQRAWCRFLISMSDDATAWSQRASMPAMVRDDAQLLLLHAGAARRQGLLDDAERLAERATEVLRGRRDEEEIESFRLLGELRYATGRKGDAHTALTRALDLAQGRVGHDVVTSGEMTATAVALLEVDVEIGQADAVVAMSDRSFAGARALDRIDLGFRSLVAKARVLATRNQSAESLQAWQQALVVVDQIHDPARQMAAWLDYADLLARSDASLRHRYACALQAAAAAAALPPGSFKDERTAFMDEAAGLVVAALGLSEAADVRDHLAAVTEEALAVSYSR